MKIILAIGGAVIKTAWGEIKELASLKAFNVLIHNGGSLFHDFQRATEPGLSSHSYTLEETVKNPTVDRAAANLVWGWVKNKNVAPKGSLTQICNNLDIPVLMFTSPGCDFWHLFSGDWASLGTLMAVDFMRFYQEMKSPFKYILMGSAVIHPEVFIKVISIAKPKEFTTVVVDFLDMYRPRTRVAIYGEYRCMTHQAFLSEWLNRLRVNFQESMGDGQKK